MCITALVSVARLGRRRAAGGADAPRIGEKVRCRGRVEIGPRAIIRELADIDAGRERITIGADAFVGPHCRIAGTVSIGRDALIAANTQIGKPGADAPVTIGRDVWIGMNARIEPGVRIGNGAIVGAGAHVTADVAAHAVVLGVPAQLRAARQAAQPEVAE
jgi:acetyltransferase-like isoleucine patch superfamily enzyme